LRALQDPWRVPRTYNLTIQGRTTLQLSKQKLSQAEEVSSGGIGAAVFRPAAACLLRELAQPPPPMVKGGLPTTTIARGNKIRILIVVVVDTSFFFFFFIGSPSSHHVDFLYSFGLSPCDERYCFGTSC
jgi:hypothetical protein